MAPELLNAGDLFGITRHNEYAYDARQPPREEQAAETVNLTTITSSFDIC